MCPPRVGRRERREIRAARLFAQELNKLEFSVMDNIATNGLERGIAHVLTGPTYRRISTAPGKRVSMLPLETVTNASLSGVEWAFSGESLSVRGFTSISNIATESELQVSFDEGSAYLFVESDEPQWFVVAAE